MVSAVLGLCLAAVPAARAGVYDLAEPRSKYALEPPYRQVGNPASVERVRFWLDDLLRVDDRTQIKDQAATPLREQYLRQADELEQQRRDGVLSPAGHVSLGGCQLRLGRWPQAMAVLEAGLRNAAPDDPVRFLLLLNLASAYQESPELLTRATEVQKQALDAWPARWAGWDHAEWAWYRRVEKFNLTLLRLRQREAAQGGRGTTLEPLFGRVRFVGPSGRYEAGPLAFEQSEELPRDAEQVVLQLMLWRPGDPRLYWLYGELLNARGDVLGSFQILDNAFANRGLSGSEELRAHRAVLLRAKDVYEEVNKPLVRQQLFWALAPHGSALPAGPAAGAADLAELAAPDPTSGVERIVDGTASPPFESGYRLPDWRVLLVGIVVGVLLTVLARYQWVEWRRRRRPAGFVPQDYARPFVSPSREPPASRVTHPEDR
jgi:tetratricopeptide (TPR) repeat protein